MCGLSGMISLSRNKAPAASAYDIFLNLFITSQLRGQDSAGVATLWEAHPDKHNKKLPPRRGCFYKKGLLSPVEAWLTCEEAVGLNKLKGKNKDKFEEPKIYHAMAHSRHATKGEISDENAHPFVFGNGRFIGTHNGTIFNAPFVYTSLLKSGTPLPNTTEAPVDYSTEEVTDSEIVLYCIYRYGIEAVYPLITGAWAFVWYSEIDNTINFIRNSQRTLFYGFDTGSDVLFYSSEKMMLQFAGSREAGRLEDSTLREFPIHTLHTLSLDKHQVLNTTSKDIEWTSTKTVRTYSYTPHMHNSSNVVPYVRRESGHNSAGSTAGYAIMTMSDDEWEAYQHSFGLEPYEESKPVLAGKDEDYPKTKTGGHSCLYCCSDAPPSAVGTIEVKGVGYVCPVCTQDLTAVSDIIEWYQQADNDINWINQFVKLNNIKLAEKEKSVHVH